MGCFLSNHPFVGLEGPKKICWKVLGAYGDSTLELTEAGRQKRGKSKDWKFFKELRGLYGTCLLNKHE